MTDRPATREYQVYTLKGDWSKVVTAESARQAVRVAAALSDNWRKDCPRIVKVVASGELLEVPPLEY